LGAQKTKGLVARFEHWLARMGSFSSLWRARSTNMTVAASCVGASLLIPLSALGAFASIAMVVHYVHRGGSPVLAVLVWLLSTALIEMFIGYQSCAVLRKSYRTYLGVESSYKDEPRLFQLFAAGMMAFVTILALIGFDLPVLLTIAISMLVHLGVLCFVLFIGGSLAVIEAFGVQFGYERILQHFGILLLLIGSAIWISLYLQ
jgi:hypothetical protein